MKLQAGRRSFGPGDQRVKLVARHGAAVVDRLVAAAAEPRAAVAGDRLHRPPVGGAGHRDDQPGERTAAHGFRCKDHGKHGGFPPPSQARAAVEKAAVRAEIAHDADRGGSAGRVAGACGVARDAVRVVAQVEIAAVGVGDARRGTHPPRPLQVAPAPQVADGSRAPRGTVVQVPKEPGRAHDRQGPAQAVAQQTPCAQNPLRHSSLELQAAGCLKPHRPALQGWPVTQSSFVAQVDLHTPRATSHANGVQMKPCAPHGWSSGRTSERSASVRSDGASPFGGASLPATSAGPSALARSAGPSPVFGWSTGASAGGASPVSLASSGSRAASLTDGAPVGSPPASAEWAATGERRQPAAATAIAATAKAARRAARLPIAPSVH